MSTYMTTEELADLCRTTAATVHYWRHAGKGPASFRLGRRVLYDRDAVEAWIKAERERQTRQANGAA